MNKSNKVPVRKAVHKNFADVQVTFRVGKDFTGTEEIQFKHSNGEKSSMLPQHFFELFTEVK